MAMKLVAEKYNLEAIDYSCCPCFSLNLSSCVLFDVVEVGRLFLYMATKHRIKGQRHCHCSRRAAVL